MESQLGDLLGISPLELREVADVPGSNVLGSPGGEGPPYPSTDMARSLDNLAETVHSALNQLESLEGESEKFQQEIQRLAGEMKQLESLSATLYGHHGSRLQASASLGPLVEKYVIPPTIVRAIAKGQIDAQWRAALAFVLRRENEISGNDSDVSSSRNGNDTGSSVSPSKTRPSISSNNEPSQEDGPDSKESLPAVSDGQVTSLPRESKTAGEQEQDSAVESTQSDQTSKGSTRQSADPSVDHSALKAQAITLIDQVLAKASERVRDFYVSRIRRLRRPGADAQEVQDELINNHTLFAFLENREPKTASTIYSAYLNTMKWYYTLLLGKYLRVLGRQPVASVDKQKLIGSLGIPVQKSFFSSSSAPAKLTPVYNIGSRSTILTSTEPALSLADAIPANGYLLEHIVRSIVAVLAENISFEAKTLGEAFAISHLSEPLGILFNASLSAAAGIIKSHVCETYDIYGLLLSIGLIKRFETSSPLFERFCREEKQVLWHRAEVVMDANCKSIEEAARKPSNYRGLSHVDPLPMTQLFASLLTGILQICPEGGFGDEPIAEKLRQLCSVFEMFVTKLSHESKETEKFLYNNYFLLSILLSDVNGDLASELANHFKLLTEAYSPK